MQIAYHIGAHCTDEDLLLASLRKNAGPLAQQGVLVPAGEVYRPMLRETLRKLQGASANTDSEDAVLEAILQGLDGRRLIMSSENFICIPGKVFEDGQFYAKMGEKARWLRNVFPSHEVSFHLGLRSPSSLVPALYARRGNLDFSAFTAKLDVEQLRWFDVLERLSKSVPDAKITVWCNEDTPLIWSEVLTRVSDLPDGSLSENQHIRLREVMTAEGMTQYLAYLSAHPSITVAQRRWAAISFLDRFSVEEAMVDALSLPGWTQDLIDRLDEHYETDLSRIADLPHVDLIMP